ncbi:unnamed protein product [Calypogeia fissa]
MSGHFIAQDAARSLQSAAVYRAIPCSRFCLWTTCRGDPNYVNPKIAAFFHQLAALATFQKPVVLPF